MARLGADRRQLRTERSRHVTEPRELHPHLRIERERALALPLPGDRPSRLDHRHESTDLPRDAEAILERGDARRLLPGAHDLTLHEQGARWGRAEREERLDLPQRRATQGRGDLEPDARERAAFEAVPHVVLHGPGDAVEGVGLPVERRAGARLHLKPLPQAALVDALLAAALIGDDDLVLGIGLLGEKRPREIELARRPARLAAQRAGVAHHGANLLGRRGVAECRHVERQAEGGASLGHDPDPAVFGLGSRALAFLQVGRGNFEARRRRGRATPVGAVARLAPRLEQRPPRPPAVPRRLSALEPISCSSPRARAPPSVASSRTVPAGSTSAPRRGFWMRAASRISANTSSRLLHGAPSAPIATWQPASSISGIFATPLPSLRLEDGQCTMFVPCCARRVISCPSTQTQWASAARAPEIPTESR